MAGSLKTMLAFIAVLVISTAIVSCQEGLNDSSIEDSTVSDSTTLPITPAARYSGQVFRPAGASSALEVPPDVPECSYEKQKCAFQVYDDQFTRRNLGDPTYYCRCPAEYECLFARDKLSMRFYEYRCSNGTVEEPVTEAPKPTEEPKPKCRGGIYNFCGFKYYRNGTKNIFAEYFFCECGEGLECRFEADDEEHLYLVHRCEDVEERVSEQVETATTPLPIQRRKGEL